MSEKTTEHQKWLNKFSIDREEYQSLRSGIENLKIGYVCSANEIQRKIESKAAAYNKLIKEYNKLLEEAEAEVYSLTAPMVRVFDKIDEDWDQAPKSFKRTDDGDAVQVWVNDINTFRFDNCGAMAAEPLDEIDDCLDLDEMADNFNQQLHRFDDIPDNVGFEPELPEEKEDAA